MPQSLAKILTHLIFSKKNWEPLLVGNDLRATNTRLFGHRVERYTMSRADRRRHHRPCACPLPAGENTIDFQHRGASEGIFLKMVEDTRKPHFQLATGLWRFFSKPIARRVGYLLHREARRAPSKDQLRGGISGNPQTLPGGL